MYHDYWGLSYSPFARGMNARAFFESSVHEEARARLEFLIEQRRRLGLLLGATGLGKSLLLEVFAEPLRAADLPVARVNVAAVAREELPGLLADQFRLSGGEHLSPIALWRRLTDFFTENTYQNRSTTILLDDVDRAEPDVMNVVTRLLHCDAALAGRLTIVLALRPDCLRRLGESLIESAELRIDLEPWTPQDTAGFVQHALLEAGRGEAMFDDEAIRHLHELSGGNPRKMSQLADLALLVGAGQNLDHIDAATIDDVSQELRPV